MVFVPMVQCLHLFARWPNSSHMARLQICRVLGFLKNSSCNEFFQFWGA